MSRRTGTLACVLAIGALPLVPGSASAAITTATVTVDPAAPQAGQPVQFTNTSGDPDPLDTRTETWDFGDGTALGSGSAPRSPRRRPTRTGRSRSCAWDLDGDGLFDDAAGATAQRIFRVAGRYTVRCAPRTTAASRRSDSKR